MKVGILTYHYSLNCGAALQAWALQEYLQSNGYNAEIVNYGKIGHPRILPPQRYQTLRQIASSLFRTGVTISTTLGIEPFRRRHYYLFRRDCMHLGAEVKKSEIPTRGYTHLITGSDQVWHPLINEGDDTYFLADVGEGVKRISYAPSFGVDTFEPSLEKRMTDWLSRFDAISVREHQGAEIVKRLSGRESTVVCDPTLLLPRDAYERIERAPCRKLPKRYIAVYTVCGHPWAEQFARNLGEQMNLPVVHLPGGQFARWYLPGKVRRITTLGPAEWLWFIHKADYVVTNSFHGTVFSLLYHRPFTVTLNNKASDARMQTLLENTGLEKMAIGQPERLQPPAEIDWDQVDQAIEAKSVAGKQFLQEALR